MVHLPLHGLAFVAKLVVSEGLSFSLWGLCRRNCTPRNPKKCLCFSKKKCERCPVMSGAFCFCLHLPCITYLISVNLIWPSSCVFRFRRTVTSKGLWSLPLMCLELNTNEKLHSTVWFRPRMCTCAVELVHCCAMDSLSNFFFLVTFYFVHCLSHAKGSSQILPGIPREPLNKSAFTASHFVSHSCVQK